MCATGFVSARWFLVCGFVSTDSQEFWRRKNCKLAARWGVLNYEQEEVPRPSFHGTLRQNEVTGEMEKHYPHWKRLPKFVVRSWGCGAACCRATWIV